MAQSYSSIEIVVVDDGSWDQTPDLVCALSDERLRLIRQRRNHGANRTWNASVAHARGKFVKFLHHDDQLHPDCVRRMVDVFERNPTVGLVFSRRHVAAGDDEASQSRAGRIAELHAPLRPLQEVNARAQLLERWWNFNAMNGNCVGEPVAVMVRRDAFLHAGLFHLFQTQYLDAEMWIRVMCAFDVGFVDDVLATYSANMSSLSAENNRRGSDWVDRLWTLETINALSPDGVDADAVRERLRAERSVARRTARSIVLRRTRNQQLRPLIRYAAWSVSCRLRRERRLPVGRLPAT